MGFVFVFRTASQRHRAEKLAKALKARGIDVCVGLEREPAEVRASVSRALVDHCALMVALWSEPELSDAAVAEPMRYAASLGKLYALSLPGAHLPANLGSVHGVSENWANSASELASVRDAIIEAASRNAPGEFDGPSDSNASEEYAAYTAMQRRGGLEAMATFLRSHPGGMFEEIVRAELDAATRPTYEPARKNGWTAFAESETHNEQEAESVWRMEASPLRAFEGLGKYWPWAGAAALAAGAIAVALLTPWSALDFSSVQTRTQRADAAVESPISRVRIAPPDAEASADPSPAEAADPNAETEADPPAVRVPAEASEGERFIGVIPVSPPPLSSTDSEPVVTAALTQPPAPAPQLPTASAGPDISQLEPAMREAVQRARSTEARALTQARSRAGVAQVVQGRPSSGAGVYYGDWSDDGASGVGRAVWASGDAYAGGWTASRPNGYGVLRLADGRRYEGEFSAGSPTGRGVFWGADGRRLTGDRLFDALVSARSR